MFHKYKEEIDKCKSDPFGVHPKSWQTSKFSLHTLGIEPYRYQHVFWKAFHDEKRVIVCKSRQTGVSTAIEIFAIHCAVENLYPSSIFQNTKIGIVSKSNDQAKQVLLSIKRIMQMADFKNNNTYFRDLLDDNRNSPNNSTTITLKNKNTIMCFPPTDAIRGYPFDVVIVDEGAYVDDIIFRDAISPTVSKTGGKIIVSSTPNGQKGYFFETFDPYEKHQDHEYVRYWIYWKHCEDLQQIRLIKQLYRTALAEGTLLNFDQEYNALFTADESSFFDSIDVDKAIDKTIAMEYKYKETPCVIGLDYGQTKSKTAITIKTKRNGKLVTLFQWAQLEFDENLLMDSTFEHSIPNLLERYDVKTIVVDDCSQAYRTNMEMETRGYPIRRYQWGKGIRDMHSKHRFYYGYRANLKKGNIVYPEIREMIVEMKQLQETAMKIGTQIHKPKNGFDDRIDSEIMASIPYIDDEGDFESIVLTGFERKKTKNVRQDGRTDYEWERLLETGGK